MKMKTTNQLVKELKEENEDFEFYPTTKEIVEKIMEYIREKRINIGDTLDIGCGNGNFFNKAEEVITEKEYCTLRFYHKYGIEKSSVLINEVVKNNTLSILGTDFFEQNLIDKKVNLIFSNPPYSIYDKWTVKILKEGNADNFILVLPSRWKENKEIKKIMEERKQTFEVIFSSDFYNAERKANCTVDIVAIEPESYSMKDPFDYWFENTFKFNAEKENDYFKDSEEKKEKRNEIIASSDTVDMLVSLYNNDMDKLYTNYKELEKLDKELFKEIGIDLKLLKDSLKKRISGLKNFYWQILFEKFNPIKSRLTYKICERITKTLDDNTSIDFTKNNIYEVTLWIIQNSNSYLDEQLSEFFFSLCKSENILRYKSNKRWNEDDWKYIKENLNHYHYAWKEEKAKYMKYLMLDYRIIVSNWKNFEYRYNDTYQLTEYAYNFLYDMSVIAENLGFKIKEFLPNTHYGAINPDYYRNFDIYYTEKENDGLFETTSENLFANIKMYQNGNIHIKFCKEFMQKLNVEMARINGWIQDKTECQNEMDFSEEEVNRYWNSNKKLLLENGIKLIGFSEKEIA